MTDQPLKSFSYRGNSISYRKIGTGPPLLFLHGWGTDHTVMLPLAQKFAKYRTCYLPDLPGFGQSPVPDTAWSVDDYADMVGKLIEELELAPVDLLVHSFGGRITLKLCARPDSLQKVDKVLITAGAGMRPRRSWRFYVKKYLAKSLKAPFYLLPTAYRDRALQKLRTSPLWKKLGSSDYRQLDGTMRQIFVKTVTEHLDDLLPDIDQEILLIWGTQDTITPPDQGKRMAEGLKNGALVTIDKAGHYAFLDRPAHFARVAHAFFKNNHRTSEG